MWQTGFIFIWERCTLTCGGRIDVEGHPAKVDTAVMAAADSGRVLLTYWSAGFQLGTAAERVVRDPSGQVVVADGEVLPIPQANWPRLRGYFVCPAPDALHVLLVDAS